MLKKEKRRKEEKETKLKLFAGIMVTLLLVTVLLYAIPTGAQFTDPPINVGIIGPMYWSHGDHMMRAAQLAAARINALGGIAGHEVILHEATTHASSGEDPTSSGGAAAMTQLMGYDVDFVQGCFRSESAFGAREVAMLNKIIFTITGAGTDYLIDWPDTDNIPGIDTVRGNYEKYKYIFRNTPMCDSLLGASIFNFLSTVMVTKLMPIFTGYAGPLPIAVVSEEAKWTENMHGYLSNNDFWNYYLGLIAYGGVDVVVASRESAVDPGWVGSKIAEIAGSGARVIIEVLAGPVGTAFVNEWGTVKPEAALVGIDVPGQLVPTHWIATGGLCETETFLCTSGGGPSPDAGTPINTVGPVTTQDFYSDYYNAYGEAPMYTAYGAFDTLMGLKESVEDWVATYGGFSGPLHEDPDYDKLIPIIEQTDRHGVVGWFKYTGPNPGHHGDYDRDTAGNQPYPYLSENPDMIGTLHDLWTVDLGALWPSGYVRALHGTWYNGILEITFPMDQPYSKVWTVPEWVYPYRTDVTCDGTRDMKDVVAASWAYGTIPGDPAWQFAADIDHDGDVDSNDHVPVCANYRIDLPLPIS